MADIRHRRSRYDQLSQRQMEENDELPDDDDNLRMNGHNTKPDDSSLLMTRTITEKVDNVECSLSHEGDETQEEPSSLNTNHRTTTVLTIEQAMERITLGWFQYSILIASGLCFAADAMQVVLLSFVGVVLQHNSWHLTQEQAASLTASLFAGATVGTLLLGPLADRIGRRPVFLSTAACISLASVAAAVTAHTYSMLLLYLAVIGVGVGGLTVPFDILAEVLPSTGRGTNLLIIEYFWTAGVLLVVVLAYATLHREDHAWRQFVILCSLPCFLSWWIGYRYVPESPRWLVSQGKYDEALAILRLAAKRNGLAVDDVLPESTRIVDDQYSPHSDSSEGENDDDDSVRPMPPHHEASVLDLLGPNWRNIMLLLWGAWFFFPVGYYGTIMLSTRVFEEDPVPSTDNSTTLEGDLTESYDFNYSAIFVSSAAELVGTTLVILLVDRIGRIRSQMASYTVAGLANLGLCQVAAAGANGSARYLLVALVFTARSFEMSGTCVTWVSTAEILTTEVRTTGHSTANAVARISALIAPFVMEGDLPLRWIGAVMVFTHAATVLCVSHLPETTGCEMGASGSERSTDGRAYNSVANLEGENNFLASESRDQMEEGENDVLVSTGSLL